MSRAREPRDPSRTEELVHALREPVRPMPASLRRSLLAIPGHQDDAAEVDRLYAAALSAASLDAGPEDDESAVADHHRLGTTPLRAAVVQLLAVVFRDARTGRPLTARLVDGLRSLTRVGGRPRWQVRWITEPRWAAAACWLLAFALTFGTGDAVAGLLEAPGKLRPASSGWSRHAESATGLLRSAWTGTRARTIAGYDLARSRVVAAGVQLEAFTERLFVEAEIARRSWTAPVLSSFAAGPHSASDPVSYPASATSNEPLHQEDRDVR